MERFITDEEARDYAEFLIFEHAQDIETLTISEMADDFFSHKEGFPGVSDDDRQVVHGLIEKAIVTVEFEEAK